MAVYGLEELKLLREKAKSSGEPILREKSFSLLLEKVGEKRPSSILEIGVNVGLTGIAMMLTSPLSRLTGIEIDGEKVSAARKNYALFGLEQRARLLVGDAGEVIPMLTAGYDFIFLDGPKGHYCEYLPYLIKSLNKGGILFADNVLFRGYVGGRVKTPHRFATAKHSLENFLNGVTDKENLKTEVYDIEDGVSVTEKLW